MPEVSVIIPCYNSAHLVARAIDSVRAQTMKDWEIVVVDDGSTDDVAGALKPYKDDARVRMIRQANKGLPGARNSGIRDARADYVVVLDADDELTPDCLALHLDKMTAEQTLWSLCDLLRVEGDDRRVLKSDIDSERPLESACLRRFYPMHSIGYHKQAFEQAGFYDESCRVYEDVDLYARMLLAGLPYSYIDKPVYIYHIQPQSLTKTSNFSRNLLANERFYRKYFSQAARGNPRIRNEYAEALWELGGKYRRHQTGLRHVLRAYSLSLLTAPGLFAGRLSRRISSLTG